MKTFVFLLCTTVFSFNTTSGFSQEKIKIKKDKIVSVDEVFRIITKQSDFSFIYPEELFEKAPKVKLKKGVIELKKLLDYTLSSSKINYNLSKNNVIVIEESNLVQHKVTKIQDITIKGIVTDEFNQPLPGANVLEKGTANGTVTDFDGNFSLTVSDPNAVISISYIGFLTQEINVNNQTSITIILQEDSAKLEEVVVVGYGSTSKRNLVGAVGIIDSEVLSSRPITQASQALYGAVSGVFINTASGEAGNDQSTIRIRGVGSFGNSNPLILIDGIEGPMDNINSDDIESITVLKDASSAAIYGSRASNGVVLVTTKRGRLNQDISINYDFSSGLSQATVLPDIVTDPRDYLEFYQTAYENSGRDRNITPAIVQRYEDLGISTNWYNEIFRKDAFMQRHALSLRGGSEKTKYSFSLGYLDQEGIIKYNQEFTRLNGRLNLDIDVSDRLKAGTSISFSRGSGLLSSKQPGFGAQTLNSGAGTLLFQQVITNHPTYPVYDSLGRFAATETTSPEIFERKNNPVGYAINNFTELLKNDFLGSVYVEYEVVDGLKIKGTLAGNYQNQSTNDKKLGWSQFDWINGNLSSGGNSNPNLTRDVQEQFNFTSLIQANYKKSFGAHNVEGIIGYNEETSKFDGSSTSYGNFALPNLVNTGTGTVLRGSGTGYEWVLKSVFGKAAYNYDSKYLFEFTLRRDGSSRFGENNRFATFPSFSAGWVLSEESFFNVPFIDFIKFRGSWGKLGNQDGGISNSFDAYPYATQYSLTENYLVGAGESLTSGVSQITIGNPDLKWETTTTTNIGFNAFLFNNDLSVEFDYFIRDTEDILTQVANPAVTGIQALTLANTASIQNKGWELSMNYKHSFNDFHFDIGGNISQIKNKVTAIDPSLSGEDDAFLLRSPQDGIRNNIYIARGHSFQSMFGYQMEGIFQTQEEIDAAPDHSFFGTPAPGDFRIQDVNGDGILNEQDQTVIGNRVPEWTYGFNTTVRWKNLSLSAIFQGISNADIYTPRDAGPSSKGSVRKWFFDNAWTPENPSTTFPRTWEDRRGYNGQFEESKPISFFVWDRSYLRLKNIQLSYEMPSSILEKLSIGLDKARFYINAQNPVTWTNLVDFDPERVLGNRYVGASLPQAKTYTLGVNITF